MDTGTPGSPEPVWWDWWCCRRYSRRSFTLPVPSRGASMCSRDHQFWFLLNKCSGGSLEGRFFRLLRRRWEVDLPQNATWIRADRSVRVLCDWRVSILCWLVPLCRLQYVGHEWRTTTLQFWQISDEDYRWSRMASSKLQYLGCQSCHRAKSIWRTDVERRLVEVQETGRENLYAAFTFHIFERWVMLTEF